MTLNGEQKVPFVDLIGPHQEIRSELMEIVGTCFDRASFIGGPLVESFEREFAAYCGSTHCVGVGSGTDALRFALAGAGVRPGDLVITVPLTFIATTEAISQVGARPMFVDIDPNSFTMDPKQLRIFLEKECVLDVETGQCLHRGLQRPVTAVIPVHLYGQIADMDAILELAEQYHLVVIEDACQAHGADYFSKKKSRWQRAGSIGHAAAFSFYPGKNLGACGEAGAITTNDGAIAQHACMLRDHGQKQKYYHQVEGYNGRLDAIQAGILRVKLKRLTGANDRRRQAAQLYDQLLSSVAGITTPARFEWSRPVHHLYVIRVQNRDRLQGQLSDTGIGTGIHYPIPLHLQNAYKSLGYREGDFPAAETLASHVLSLPMFPGLTREQQQMVAAQVKKSMSAPSAKDSPAEISPALQSL